MPKRKTPFTVSKIRLFLDDLFKDHLHAKRVDSLARGALGTIQSAALGVHIIGHGLAYATGISDKSAIKQIDRLLSNDGIDVWDFFDLWVPNMLGEREEALVALDWTDFDQDDQTTLVASLITNHGRATPLVWRTVKKTELKGQRQQHEAQVVLKLLRAIPEAVQVTLLADRGFDDHKFMGFIKGLCRFDYVIRFRGNTLVEAETGERRPAREWVGVGGRAKMLRNAKITSKGFSVATVVCVWDREMKEPWCLASSRTRQDAKQFIRWYAKRWSIESSFRDMKSTTYGLGLGHARISRCDRRDRMILIAALAIVLMTLLGAAGESLGLDRLLKANTVKTRTYSLLRQGYMWYQHIPMMPDDRLRSLMTRFGELVQEHSVFKKVVGCV